MHRGQLRSYAPPPPCRYTAVTCGASARVYAFTPSERGWLRDDVAMQRSTLAMASAQIQRRVSTAPAFVRLPSHTLLLPCADVVLLTLASESLASRGASKPGVDVPVSYN